MMSEDSDKEDQLFGQCTSEEAESDEDSFSPFVPEDLQQYEFSDAICDPFNQRTTQVIFEYHSGRQVRRLREPRSLYGVSSINSVHTARWPYECEVIEERIWHIEYSPPVPEPLYRPTGREQEPSYVDSSLGRVVYLMNEANKSSYFICSRVGGNRHLRDVTTPVHETVSNKTLIFESRFESGNLQKVVQVGDYDYQLTLRTDLYTDRHTQWFYFRVQNTQTGIPYRFTIVNLTKPSSLYSVGMRPLMYSELQAATHQVGWHRVGNEIKYYRNDLDQDRQQYYSLSWKLKFQHHQDTCYFAHCYPYTYSNLQSYLADIASDPERSKFCKIRVLCQSLARNMVYVLTITNPSTSDEEVKRKKAVILTARVHPGETNSSWMMKGFLDYILSSKKDACLLRDNFIFKVVPMLNPDGVIVGNYRCSLSGRDLNRNYRTILKDSFPSVWYTRNMIKRMMEEREVLLYCDLHGHSRKQNVFMYGCATRGQTESTRLRERVFPLMLHKNCPEKFSILACKFKVQKSKEGTGRVVMWRMGIRNSYTMEATFCGSTLGRRRGTHFSTKDLESMGFHFCDALLDYCDPDQTKYQHCLKELGEIEKLRTKHSMEGAFSDSDISLVDGGWDQDSSTEGSDSSESNGLPAHLLDLTSKRKSRKKRFKTKKERNSCFAHLELANEEFTEEMQANRRTASKKPITHKALHDLGTKNSHARHTRKFDGLQRLHVNHIPSLDGRNIFDDLDGKKVAVVYLFFDSQGDVHTKSHSKLQKETLQQANHGIKEEFIWRNSHLQSRNPPSQRILVPNTASRTTAFGRSYYIGANEEDVNLLAPYLPEPGCDFREEVESKSCKRGKKTALSTLRPFGKHSGATRKPHLRSSSIMKHPVQPVLYEHLNQDPLALKRNYGSAPIYPANSEEWQIKSGHHHNKNEPNNRSSAMHLKSINERARSQDQTHEESSAKLLRKLQLSLPAVPGASSGLRNALMNSENSVEELITATVCSKQNYVPHRELAVSSLQRSCTGSFTCEHQKTLHELTTCPAGNVDVAKNTNSKTWIPVTKYTKIPAGIWSDGLQGPGAPLVIDGLNKPPPSNNYRRSIHRTTEEDATGDSGQHGSFENRKQNF
ncbi:cytosolic carboxypeptidase 3 isoform X2 [Lissotriton helveticus]